MVQDETPQGGIKNSTSNFQPSVPQAVVALDIGNTRVKWGVFSPDAHPIFGACLAADFRPEKIDAIPPASLLALSTVGKFSERIIDEWSRFGKPVDYVLRSDGTIFNMGLVSSGIETPETTGVDRVLGCLGAWLRADHQSVIVVDCGTAVTTNVMTAHRVFAGGFIAPGLRLLASSLHTGTAALPAVSWDESPSVLGRSTRSAISGGVAASFLGGITRTVAQSLVQFPDAKVFITGGDRDVCCKEFPNLGIPAPYLVLEGLAWWARQCQNPQPLPPV